jgi:hypothetical protein
MHLEHHLQQRSQGLVGPTICIIPGYRQGVKSSLYENEVPFYGRARLGRVRGSLTAAVNPPILSETPRAKARQGEQTENRLVIRPSMVPDQLALVTCPR